MLRAVLVAVVGLVCSCGRLNYDGAVLADVNLRVDWVTPNAVRWLWDDPTTSTELVEYKFVLATKESDLPYGEGVLMFSSNENPELGILDDDTITDRLEPATRYFGQLIGLDATGRQAQSDIVAITTAPAVSQEIVIFADDPTDGYSIPSELVHSDQGANNGTHCYRYVHVCEPDRSECFENLRRQGISFDLSQIPEDRFAAAYVEFSMAADGPLHSPFSQVRLMMRDVVADNTRVFSLGGWSHRADGNYRTYQFPITSLVDDGEALDRTIALQREVFEFGVGASFSVGSVVRLDDVRIRY